MIKLNINKPTYGKSYDGKCYWKITNGIAEVYISLFNSVAVQVNYDVALNTYKHKSAKEISKQEFEKELKIVKKLIWRLKA